jgi:hypothetical protein
MHGCFSIGFHIRSESRHLICARAVPKPDFRSMVFEHSISTHAYRVLYCSSHLLSSCYFAVTEKQLTIFRHRCGLNIERDHRDG